MAIEISIASVELGKEEIEEAVKVLKSGKLIQGEKVKEFEKFFARKVGARYAVAVSSGTAALHIAYLSLIKPDDEVLVPGFTHISTASMVCFAGGVPVFCDIDPKTFTMDIDDIKKKITSRTRAIAPVHLYGNACEIEEILAIAGEKKLKVIWDAAQAHMTKYRGKDVGCFGDATCYSFYPTKNMTTGEGGMITTNSPELCEKFKLLRSHGQEKKYYHTMLGLHYRMTEVEAAIGIVQLNKLDYFIQRRRENAEHLNRELSSVPGITTPFVEKHVEHSYHQYSIVLDGKIDRDGLINSLREKGIGTAIHYPRPVHKQPVFYSNDKLKVCEYLSDRVLSLPVGPKVTLNEIKYIAESIKKNIKDYLL